MQYLCNDKNVNILVTEFDSKYKIPNIIKSWLDIKYFLEFSFMITEINCLCVNL